MNCLKCGIKLNLDAKFCPECGEPTPLTDDNKTGNINIIREKKLFAFAIPFSVYIDDTLIGELKNGTTLSTNIAIGSHKLLLKSTEKDVIQDIILTEDKKEANIYIIPKMGLIAARPHIKEIVYK